MTFKRLNTSFSLSLAALSVAFILGSCNNADQSANNSTKGEDTVTKKSDATAEKPKKKSGKVSGSMTADDPSLKIEKDKMGIYSRTEVAPE